MGVTGISPCAITACLLCYRSDGKEEQNVQVMQDAVVLAGGKENAEVRRGG